MKAKDFVLNQCPTAIVSKLIGLDGFQVCTTYKKNKTIYQIGVGSTNIKAWVSAAKNVAKKIVLEKYLHCLDEGSY